jgi:hypothetical protein
MVGISVASAHYKLISFDLFKEMYVDPYAATVTQDVAWQQGQMDQCCRIVCWILVSLFVLGLVIWLIQWITRPSYTRTYVVRHNLVSAMHKANHLHAI